MSLHYGAILISEAGSKSGRKNVKMKILNKFSAKGSFFAALACAVLFLLLSTAFCQTYVQSIGFSSGINDTVVGECVANTVIEQTLSIPPTANKLSLLLATYRNKLEGHLNIRLVHSPENTLIQEWDIANETIEDNRFYSLELKRNFSAGNTDDRYAIIIESDSLCKPGSSPTIWQSSTNTYPGGDLYINGNKNAGDLCFEIHYKSPGILRIYFLIVHILFLLLIASFLLLSQSGCSIEKLFTIYALMLGLAYMIVFPAESAPDEDRHIITAYNLSNFLLAGPEPEEALVYFRDEDLSGLYNEFPNAQTYITLDSNFGKDSHRGDYILVEDDFVIPMPFWTYLPQAVGISLGRICNCNGTVTILLGRLFSLFFFTGVTCFSMKIIPFGKNILFAVSLLPMTLELTASYSYDSMIIALAFLFIALLCRLIFAKESLAIRDILFPAVVISLLAPLKYVYIPLVILSLLLPGERYKAKREKWISISILFGSITVVLLSLRGGQQIYIPSFDAPEYRTVAYCLRNVKEVICVYWNTLVQKTPYYISTMVGMSLGWLEIHMPLEVFALSILNLFMSTIQTDLQSRICIRNRHYFVFSICFFSVFFLTLTAMLLAWTPVSSMCIEGVQGRYFLPVLPLFMLCIQKMDIRSAKSMVKPIAYVGFWTNTLCLWYGFAIIANR